MGFARRRLRSFGYALKGVRLILRTQHNAWIHAAATVLVLIAGFLFEVTPPEWTALIIACMIVWIAEAFNTALELLADAAVPRFHAGIGRAKDVAAGAVLIAAAGAVAVGLRIFAPRLLSLALS